MRNNNKKEIQGTMEKNRCIILDEIAYEDFYKRIKLPEFCYYFYDGRENGGNKDNKNFVFHINKTELEAEIKLDEYIDGSRRDVMIINDGKNSIVLQLMRHKLEKITPEDIKGSLYYITIGQGYVKYSNDEGFNGKNKDKIIVDLQKLFIKNMDIANYNKHLGKQRKNGNLNR